MTATSTPFGLKPLQHPSGFAKPSAIYLSKTQVEAMATLRQNQPCKINTDGALTTVTTNAEDFIGSFNGIIYTTTDGRPVISNQWTNGTTVLDQGSRSAQVFFWRDPWIIYQIQATAALTDAVLGEQIGFASFTTGNSTTGLAQTTADASTVGTAQDMLRIVGLALLPDNDWTDSFPVIYVQIARHQDVSNKAGY